MGIRTAAVAATVLAVTLSACGSSTEKSSGNADGTGKKLTVWIMEGTNPDSSAYFDAAKKMFKDTTSADLDIQMVPWASAKDKFTTAIAGGTTPDVAEVGSTWTAEFADAGALADLTEQVKDTKLDGDLVAALKDAGTVDGKLYGMPWYAGIRAFLYHKDIFAKAGITTPPKTWADLKSAVDAIKKTQPDVIPFVVPGASEFTVTPFIWGAGGTLAALDGDRWTSRISDTHAVEGITFLADIALTQKSSTPAAATWNEKDVLTAYGKGNVGMVVAGSWTPTTLRKNSPTVAAKTGAFTVPGKNGMAQSFAGGSHLAIFEKSNNKKLAFEFVKLMTTGDLATRWGQESHYFPGRTSLLSDRATSGDDITKVFATQMSQGAASVPVSPLWGKVQGKKVIPTMMQSILSGKAAPRQAAETAAKDMDDIFTAQ
ncbi:Diacetylchitobiose binding protein DasA [Austwickia sp. TVS 96-490-7B]|uniref:sugar ABC transporter substrate-binding protein n=1 Tax=Austwickia sp. TVS 96-490-7B TaxID=2830843 RepID=UPI001C58C7FD|nr:sugar ABC transporter substrate-binding protein [Austwickia sp. TVS 96-490-7B]MBW3084356.1 Diacetylchitobiose binding protein DasA [Austwickia sp. TVS 96-490-7B]